MNARIYVVLRVILKCTALLVLGASPLLAQSAKEPAQVRRRPAKKPAIKVGQPPPQPTAIAPLAPEQLPAEPPRVSYQNGILTIESQNSTLNDILNAVRRQTGAQIDAPPVGARERMAAHLSGPPRKVLSSLLSGSNMGYALIGAPDNPERLQKVILVMQSRTAGGQSGGASGFSAAPQPSPIGSASPQYQPEPDLSPAEEQGFADRAGPQRGPEPGTSPQHPGVVEPGGTVGPGGAPQDETNNPFPNGEPDRYANRPGQTAQPQSSNQPQQNPNQPQVRNPDELLRELQKLRNQQQQNQPAQ